MILAQVSGPKIDWLAISPLVALTAGIVVVLMAGLVRAPFVRHTVVPLLTLVALAAAAVCSVITWGDNTSVVAGAVRMDDLTLALTFVFVVAGAACVLLSWRGIATREAGHGEYHCLLLNAVLGMIVLAGATNLVTVFVGYELLSIPLYVMCATEMRRATSLESGLKYLIIGSVGSATLLYGLALVYGATGSTDFEPHRRRDRGGGGRSAAAGGRGARRDRAGVQGLGGPVPPVDARRLRGRPDSR